MDFGIPILKRDLLSTLVPERTHAGGPIADPSVTLFVWRTCRFPAEARGGVLAFYTEDYRFECLWRQPERYAEQFAHFGWGAVIEPDFSTWADAPLVEQLWAIYRMRTLGRLYQEHGLRIIPNFAWSDVRSFEFAFSGIPRHAPVVAVECRTAGQGDGDRRAFLAGLSEGIRQVAPQTVLIYGAADSRHTSWLTPHLPSGPRYVLLPSWTALRDRRRAEARRQERVRNQLTLFPAGGNEAWADEDPQAA
jgi:hypothetical protein